ncbi:MAG: M1 family metallopeptidase [Nocardioidaceae bacterium]
MIGRRSGADSYVPGHGDSRYDVAHYDLDLTYKVEGNYLSGIARIHGVARVETDELTLDLHGLKVSKLALEGHDAKYRVRQGKVQLRPGTPLPAGQAFVVVVHYAGNPKQLRLRHLGSAGWEELTDGALVAAQPHGAPSWFPCNDRPSSKASYRISLTVPTGYRAVANGTRTHQRRHAGSTTSVYRQDEPMAPYLATVQIGRYTRVPLDAPVECHAWLPAHLRQRLPDAFADQGRMLETFIDAFGPYPFGSYDVVVTDDDLEIPLESQGLSTFGANHLRADWDCVRLVAHELSHQWFGNSLTVDAWKDIWLHEGFACYSEWIWSEAGSRETAHEQAIRHHERLRQQPQDLLLSDPGPDLMFDDRVYKRGARTLHALRCTLGDDAFFALLRSWVAEHAHGTVSTAQFTTHAQAHSDVDLTPLFDAWLYRRELPDLPRRG